MECFDSFKERITEVTLIAAAAEEALDKRTPSERLKANAMTRAGLVLLCGYFEGYIREAVEEFVDIVHDEAVGVNDLPSGLFCSVIEDIPIKRKKSKSDGAVFNFKASVLENSAVLLDRGKLSKTGGNPTVAVVESIFEAIGIPSIIDELSVTDYSVDSTFVLERQADKLRAGFNEALISEYGVPSPELLERLLAQIDRSWQPLKKRRKVGYVSDIEEMLKLRNRIAHGEGLPQITPLELFETASKIESLALGISERIEGLIRSLSSPQVEQPV
ncbi:MAE_28990/MAE_18760 family HEPN-like nuclease [Pseudomonas chengduensis]|nr:MAE_28990/MAE_18760 family HEPN-like nuclease [Pseudomonas chengduensis]MDH0959371.1 MAE_28990/MAE_18760 family HEPN-like nuclease [Pseudomonas chengduensis]